jgi:hypothetical protein
MTQPPQDPYNPSPYGARYQQATPSSACIPFATFIAIGLGIAVLVRSKDGRSLDERRVRCAVNDPTLGGTLDQIRPLPTA